MVSKTTLKLFEDKGGYDTLESETKGWTAYGIISRLAKKTGLSRPVIYDIKKSYPIRPSKIMFKYQVKFLESEGWQRVVAGITPKQRKYITDIQRVMLKAFHFLGDIDPAGWTVEDIQKLRRNCVDMRDTETEDIRFENAVNLRRSLRSMRKYELLEALKDVPKRKPGKLQWFLQEEDLIKFIHSIIEVDTLLLFYTGDLSGARFSGIVTLTPERVNATQGEFLIYEPKMAAKGRAWVYKNAPRCFFDLLTKYMVDFNIRGKERLFKWSYTTYNKRLKEAGRRAGLTKTTSTHILKHTFVSLASLHNVSLDVISMQTGTDEETLKSFYRAESDKRKRHELMGETYTVKPWYTFIKDDIHPHFEKRYNEIKGYSVKVDRITTKKKTKKPRKEKPKKKRPFEWKSITALSKSEKTSNRKFFQMILKWHQQGMSDAKIRKKLEERKKHKK